MDSLMHGASHGTLESSPKKVHAILGEVSRILTNASTDEVIPLHIRKLAALACAGDPIGFHLCQIP